jgi:Mg-chelatase subunit ChlD
MAAKGLLAVLMETSYRRRARVALMQFGGREAMMVMPPRRAPKNQRPLLEVIHGGGGTPLRRGLEKASAVLRQERLRNPQQQQTLVLMTDGRSRDSVAGLEPVCPTVVVDTEAGSVRLGRCRGLAAALGAEYIPLDSLPRVSTAK